MDPETSSDGSPRFSPVAFNDHAGQLWIVTILSLIYSVLVATARAYIKYQMFGFDDVLIALAMSTLAAVVLCLSALSLAKCSVLALILRIIGSKTGRSRLVCIGLMVLSAVWGVGSCLAFLINCRANSLLTPNNVKQCPNQHTRWAVITAIDVSTEILTWLLVVQLSWTVTMSEVVLRNARFSELPEIAHIMAKAFWEDNLFGQLIHPHRNEHPDDVDLYWLRRARVSFWDYRCRWLVAVAQDKNGREVIVGAAQWARLGDGGKKLECWYLDPRNLLKPLSSVAMDVHAWVWPNRASNPDNEDVIERAYPFFEAIWSGKRAESWYLEALAVHPDFQGRNIGRKLVQWGLEQAEAEGVCASVISAMGKDEFYTKCGFDEQYGSGTQGDGNPLVGVEGANMFWKWPTEASKQGN
ncbi:hypothetical protein AK830_g39 [Neonectria ditissima]|uniref:N-acetyltransferase domain-containing protein n=1 Tax=Neonectria ditissima TaxID=78410 RepID=A0A0P7B851_9HYPO|nr:hypothetical protein AK830_g39 [Neonectria ditissima]